MSEQKINNLIEQIKIEEEIFISFLRTKFPFFYKSNFFFRDLEYGIKSYFKKKNIHISSEENLLMTNEIGSYFEDKDYFKKINNGVWMINLPQYVTEKPGDPF